MNIMDALLAGLSLALLTLVSPALAGETAPLPEGEGKELVAEVCNGCHDTGRILAGKGQSAEDWRGIVLNMAGRGAQVFPDEIETIVRYLSTYFGPDGETDDRGRPPRR